MIYLHHHNQLTKLHIYSCILGLELRKIENWLNSLLKEQVILGLSVFV